MASLFDHLPGEVTKLSISDTVISYKKLLILGRLVGMTLATRIQTVPYRQGRIIKRFNIVWCNAV